MNVFFVSVGKSKTGAGGEVIMSIAGHDSRSVLSRYSHVRMEAKRRSLDDISQRQRSADEKREQEVERPERAAIVSLSAVVQWGHSGDWRAKLIDRDCYSSCGDWPIGLGGRRPGPYRRSRERDISGVMAAESLFWEGCVAGHFGGSATIRSATRDLGTGASERSPSCCASKMSAKRLPTSHHSQTRPNSPGLRRTSDL